MNTILRLGLIFGMAMLVACEDQNSVTTGPTRRAPRSGDSTTTTVEEPNPVDIPTKPGSQNQNTLPHGQPDSSGN